MDKKVIWGGIALIIILATLGFMLSRKDRVQPEVVTESPAIDPSSGTSSAPVPIERQSLRDLMSANTAQQCTFVDGSDRGVTYVADGKVRIDFTTVVDGKDENAHVIVRDNASYFWLDNVTTGFKTALTAMNQTSGQGNSPSRQVDIDKKGNYICGVWVAAESMFELPSSVTFTDLSQLMQVVPKQ